MDPRVLDRLQSVQREHFGNPASSSHAFGWAAAKLVEEAREEVARLVGGTAREIIFTSGATESNNLALKGVAGRYALHGDRMVSTVLEHEAVAEPLAQLRRAGWEVAAIPVGREGVVDPADVATALTERTVLVTVIAAQNEIGTLQPLREIGALCKKHGILFHSDAAQAAGKIELDVQALGIDLLSLSGHKLYGPKGVGALYVRRRDPRVALEPQITGGGQERGLRAGTLNVPAIVAFGEACRLAREEMPAEAQRLRSLRDRLLSQLQSSLPGVHLNGSADLRLPGNLNLSFAGVMAHRLLGVLTLLAVSSSSACSSAESQPSAVLTALGVPSDLASASLRIGLGRGTTVEEVDFAAAKIIAAVTQLRKENPWDSRATL